MLSEYPKKIYGFDNTLTSLGFTSFDVMAELGNALEVGEAYQNRSV